VSKHRFYNKFWIILIVPGLALLFGCAAAVVGGAAGAGAVLYSKGELKSTENAPLEQVLTAEEAMNSMNFNVISKDHDALKGKLLAKRENGDNIDIKLEQKPNNLTEMKIRVGAFGNEDQARLIQEKIRQKLS
jgi:hypothetical protein